MSSSIFASSTHWYNWARSARCNPHRLLRISAEHEIVSAISHARERGLTLRVAGTGHSFNPSVTTDGVLVDLSGYSGVVRLDAERQQVTVKSGTRLRELNRMLQAAGLALVNMGTLEEQTIGGAISTGNHGSGISHGPFASQVIALTVVLANGSVLSCDAQQNPRLFLALTPSLGVLGVISTVTLRCVPKFNLRVTTEKQKLKDILGDINEFARSSEHATFSLKAWSDDASVLKLDPTQDTVSSGAKARRRANTLDEVRCASAGLFGSIDQRLVQWTMNVGNKPSGPSSYVDVSYRAFTFPQPVKFLSLEYGLSLSSASQAVQSAQSFIKRFGLRTPYSVTVRFGAGDDSLLSIANARDTAYVNITVPRTVAYTELLRLFEAAMQDHGGRPHWGKAHTATAQQLRALYPAWGEFQQLRRDMDPQSLFTSEYARRVLGVAASHQ